MYCCWLYVFITLHSDKSTCNGISKNQPLLKVFESIEKQTKLSIAYNQTKLNVNQKVTVDFKNESTATVLNAVLKNTGFSYRTEGEHIIIIPQPASVTNGKQENSAPKKKNSRNHYRYQR